MPTIDVDYAELYRELRIANPFIGGHPIQKSTTEVAKELDDKLAFIKGEVKFYDGNTGTISIEMKDTNRPDLWSVEGLARGLGGFQDIAEGLKKYTLGKSIVDVQVDSRLEKIRPFIGCAIVKNVSLTDTIIRGLMHLQDKLDQTYGRSRQKTSIGIYDFNLINPPLSYTVAKPEEIIFVPLGFTEKMNLKEILKHHPKGIEYGHIVNKHSVYPILLDSDKKVLSFPPIINSNDLGHISELTRNVLIEVTGTMHETVLNALKLVTLALIDRGGEPFAATVDYGRGKLKEVTPDFSERRFDLDVNYTNELLGLPLTGKRIAELLGVAGLGVEKVGLNKVSVIVPCYRVDVMHQVDLVEDVAIAYGYNNIEPVWRELPTTGCSRPEQRLLDTARELMFGLGFQEILTNTLTNPENLFTKMNMDLADKSNTHRTCMVEILNPKVVTMTCLRNWLLPSLMEFLSNNQSVEFPQRIFELGKITMPDRLQETRTRDEEWLAAIVSHANAGFSEIKSALDSFFMNLGLDWQIKAANHPSFIEGRVGEATVNGVTVCVLGEIDPKVLVAWKLENPTAAFELNMRKMLALGLL
ncbi:MAG TPA: phenylalanine--tRNA ligase subunit beta [Candidatus Bathyarchaeia archaeon]|nr:phenylalanine--tRNA ligase subunit beta [Candidatus Bathyarchaeia archaeon]